LQGIKYKKPIYTYISGTLGCVLNPEEMTDEYWIQNLVQPVRFEAACLTAYEMGARICLDVGPHPILATLFAANVDAIPNADLVLCIPSLRKNADDVMTIMTSIASMHVSGFCVDWFKLHEKWDGEKTALPTYPFQRKSYWFPQVKRRGFGLDEETAIHPLLGHSFSNASTDTIFQSLVLVKEQPYLEDHKIGE
jgi:acyl transferase domain-containing protein